ncbi:MAG: cytochrome c biogenesis protein CcsA [Bacteroidota bacterium]|nr:cytochrome c biogenesis protein CcsA [Bacteroidota bacterium]MDP4230640.1 cytochrome c biogenesis protein CcsA [Bacteroidota bacterium]MDP4236835.1 cytochrome c biogenesis protein CcsA [Bacteroidota bacterium]
MLQASNTIQAILPFLYGILLLGFANVFIRPGSNRTWIFPAVLVTLLLHGIYIGLYTITVGHCLLTTSYEMFSLIAFTLLVTYAIVEIRPKEIAAGTGTMVSLVAFLFQLISSLAARGENPMVKNPIFSDPYFNVHVTSAVFGYAALTLATIYGSLYLLLYRAMKKNTFGSIYEELPSLGRLERFGIRSSAVGFIFLSISILFGVLLINKSMPISQGTSYLLDPKTIATVLTWLVFGSTLVVRRIAKVEGKKLVIFWMSGFALTLVSMTIINAFGTEYHNFL